MKQKIKEYNKLVHTWNQRYSKCSAMKLDPDENIDLTLSKSIRSLRSQEMNPRKKLKITRTVVGDYANLNRGHIPKTEGKLSKSELATLIVKRSDELLKNSRNII